MNEPNEAASLLVSPWAAAMELALAAADEAATWGDVPIGAVVLDEDGSLLATGQNVREKAGDPTGHAEIVALRRAAEKRGSWRLTGTTLVVTLEPCAMCAGALVNARVGRVVYGASDTKAGAVRTLFTICDDPRLNHRLEVVPDVLADESRRRLRAFFAKLRAEGQK
jgi:tRNA(adenine34) deaminase